MSIFLMSRFFKMNMGGCNRKLVAVRLADFADDEGRGIYPGVPRLVAETELSERTVQRILADFEAEGLLVCRQRATGKRGMANRYDFDLDVMARIEAGAPSGVTLAPDGRGATHAATGVTGDADGCQGDTLTVIEPPLEPSLERERASGREEGSTDGKAEPAGESRDAIERGFKRFYPTWPTYVGDSEPAARRAWFELSADERHAAAERVADYVEHAKAGGRKTICSAGVYLAEKRWEKLPERPTAKPAERSKMAAPFGKAWGAMRLRLLLEPMADLPPLDKWSQIVIDQKPEKRESFMRDHREKHGWPMVTRMHDVLRGRQPGQSGFPVSDEDVALGESFIQVEVGSALWGAWKRLHEARGWPWLPDPGRQEWVWMPAPDVQTADVDKAVAAAVEAFRRRVEGEQHAAAE